MRAKEELLKIKEKYDRLQRELWELEKLDSFSTKITSALGGEVVSGSRQTDKMTDIVADLIELKKEVAAAEANYRETRLYYFSIIKEIPDEIQFKILYGVYFEFKKLSAVAKENHYGYRYICKVHGRALQEVENLLEKREKRSAAEK